MLPKSYRIRKNEEFRKIYKASKSFANKYLVIYIKKNYLNKTRFGYSISKKIGKANERNYLKRLMREISRKNLCYIKKGYDIVFIARIKIKELDFDGLEKNMLYMFKKGSVINEGK